MRAGRARLGDSPPSAAPRLWATPGHYASPIPDVRALEARTDELWGPSASELPGIDLNVATQLSILENLGPLVHDVPYASSSERGSRELRYHADNSMFGPPSACTLHLLLRYWRPQRVVEVGSGFSSAVMLDTSEYFLEAPIELTFIEPHPERLRSLLRPADSQNVRVIEQPLEDVPRSLFGALQSGDLLFIDSSHVLKTGSDVNVALFEILPSLAPGVFVHFHDILYPFEYPRNWVLEGRAWNEAYALRAFLQYNDTFEIVFWTSYLHQHQRRALDAIPLISANGSSLWLRKKR